MGVGEAEAVVAGRAPLPIPSQTAPSSGGPTRPRLSPPHPT